MGIVNFIIEPIGKLNSTIIITHKTKAELFCKFNNLRDYRQPTNIPQIITISNTFISSIPQIIHHHHKHQIIEMKQKKIKVFSGPVM